MQRPFYKFLFIIIKLGPYCCLQEIYMSTVIGQEASLYFNGIFKSITLSKRPSFSSYSSSFSPSLPSSPLSSLFSPELTFQLSLPSLPSLPLTLSLFPFSLPSNPSLPSLPPFNPIGHLHILPYICLPYLHITHSLLSHFPSSLHAIHSSPSTDLAYSPVPPLSLPCLMSACSLSRYQWFVVCGGSRCSCLSPYGAIFHCCPGKPFIMTVVNTTLKPDTNKPLTSDFQSCGSH